VKKPKATVLLLVALALAGVFVFWARRIVQMDEAVAILRDYSKGTAEQLRAVEFLSSRKDSRTTRELIAVLSDERTRPDTRVLVASALRGRHELQVSIALSETMQLHTAPALRQEAVKALQGLSCTGLCTKNLLHYMERLWWGEHPSELLSPWKPESEQYFKRLEAEVLSGVEQILLANRAATIEQLRKIYGLGSSGPSVFALHVVQVLNFHEACGDLSLRFLQGISDQEVRKAIDSTIDKLGCNAGR
jgi:hypothetical protein